MEKIFWSNPYQHTLDTKIISINGNEILLEKPSRFHFQEDRKAIEHSSMALKYSVHE